jgi:DNA-binding PadR family transcriptional regulator
MLIIRGMRRKAGVLLPIEVSILVAGLDLDGRGVAEFHGYLLASEIADRDGARRLIAHGSLYRALGRLEAAGLLESRWEDPDLGAAEGRPRRRLYHVTVAGARAANRAIAEGAARVLDPRPEAAAS